MDMPAMLAYTIVGGLASGSVPEIVIGQGSSKKYLKPDSPLDDSYWFCIMDANNPTNKVKEFVVPGAQNAQVPTGLDTYMSNPAYIFACVTQNLSTLHVPQGSFYTYLTQHGSGRALQRLEQINTSLGCGSISRMSYILTAQGGNTFGYELGDTKTAMLMLMSLMPGKNGTPPYSICDSNTFNT
jgi:hypothetical protein